MPDNMQPTIHFCTYFAAHYSLITLNRLCNCTDQCVCVAPAALWCVAPELNTFVNINRLLSDANLPRVIALYTALLYTEANMSAVGEKEVTDTGAVLKVLYLRNVMGSRTKMYPRAWSGCTEWGFIGHFFPHCVFCEWALTGHKHSLLHFNWFQKKSSLFSEGKLALHFSWFGVIDFLCAPYFRFSLALV